MNSRRFMGSPPQIGSRTLPHHRARKPTCIAAKSDHSCPSWVVRHGSVVCVSAAPNCASDEGGPFGVGNHELISSHRKLLWPITMVVSVAETPGQDPGRQG